jgi:shikimate kinase
MRFVDIDEEVERIAGKTIPEIFDAEGEPAFRIKPRRLKRRWKGLRH